jgi:LysR family transcriptional regulator, glycine cleavage system transcriptional activator
MGRFYDLSSLGNLQCFEAAARHMSFKKAAAELNVTPTAVSHRIRALEEDLGMRLFERTNRGVSLTVSGTSLLGTVQRGFEDISREIGAIRNQSRPQGVTISASPAVSSFWLTRKIAAFWEQNSEMTVTQIVSNGFPDEYPDVDLSIVYGDPSRETAETAVLFTDSIFALGSAAFRDKHKISGLQSLLAAPVIHIDSNRQSDADWPEWPEWIAAHGLQDLRGAQYRFNNFMVALRAGEEGLGAVLGWERLLGHAIDGSRLVKLAPQSMAAPWPFYIRIGRDACENSRQFAQWLSATGE